LRPEFYSTGRARLEAIQRWRAEEELASKREGCGWLSVEEMCLSRHHAVKVRFEEARQREVSHEEELSYLTVGADLPLEEVTLPVAIRSWTGEQGQFFHTEQGELIYGPKTEKEYWRDGVEDGRRLLYEKNRAEREEKLRLKAEAIAKREKIYQKEEEWFPRGEVGSGS
jgi:hypothetical protein